MKASHISIILFLLCRTVSVSGRTTEDMMNEWSRYKNECLLRMHTEPSPKEPMCRRRFDGYACWPDGRPNSTVKVPCPWYLPWYSQVHGGFVSRECGPDGKWATGNSSHTWRNHSQCDADDSQQVAQKKQMKILACFRVMYTVCYCLSLVSLSVALIILLFFSKLHCTRNSIHSNLFASFILRALSILTRDALLSKTHLEFRHSRDVSEVLSDQGLSSCRVAQVLMQYCVGANYYWLLVEGLYLHNLLALVAFSERCFFCGYLLLGWGTPVLFVVPWIVARCLYENTRCWEINENMAYWYIIRTPILLAIMVNFFIFIRIILILVSKLKAHQMRATDYKFRLAKSTLTLIPLLGIHELVFAVSTNVQTEEVFHNASLFFQLFFNSSQGFLVAILYCFVNKEVQAELKKTWQRWKLGMTDPDELRNTGSNIAQAPVSVPPSSQCHHLSPHQPPTRCPEVSHLSSMPHASPPLPHSFTHHQDKMANKQLKSYCCFSGRTQDRGGETVGQMYSIHSTGAFQNHMDGFVLSSVAEVSTADHAGPRAAGSGFSISEPFIKNSECRFVDR